MGHLVFRTIMKKINIVENIFFSGSISGSKRGTNLISFKRRLKSIA